MTFSSRLRCLLPLLLLAYSACSPAEEFRQAPTEVMLRIDASESLRRSAVTLRIALARPLPFGEGEKVMWASSTTSIPLSRLKWPVDMPVVPRTEADSFSEFEVVVELMDSKRALAQARVVSAFVPGERRLLPLTISLCPGRQVGFVCAEAGCHGASCSVCGSDGSCGPVGSTMITDLPTLDEGNAGIGSSRDVDAETLAGRDAAKDGGTARDSMFDRDVRDAVDRKSDAGPADLPAEPASAACDEEGAIRCTESGTALRQRCTDGAWVEHDVCQEGSVCDEAKGRGACRELAALCVGNAGKPVCEREKMHFCDEEAGISRTETCKSERHCTQGRTAGRCPECLPGEYRCVAEKLEVCADDGSAFRTSQTCASAALCNEAAGACTSAPCRSDAAMCVGDELRTCKADESGFNPGTQCMPGLCDAVGKQCDNCQPGKSCAGNSVLSCSADGQMLTMQACAAPRPVCAGEGLCVECTAASPCAQPADACKSASCDVARGMCSVINRPSGSTCPGGRCNEGGRCVGCLTASDCPRSQQECVEATCGAGGTCGTAQKRAGTSCRTGVCDGAGECVECTSDAACTTGMLRRCAANRCVQCTSAAHCGPSETCSRNVCVAKCGNGTIDDGEECEQGVAGWTTQTCNSTTCRRTAYLACTTNAQCQFNEECQQGVCTTSCWGSTSEDSQGMCKTIPTHTKSCYLDICFVRCSNTGGCPSGLFCQNNPEVGVFDGHCIGAPP
jgi:hypothetical protein